MKLLPYKEIENFLANFKYFKTVASVISAENLSYRKAAQCPVDI